MTPRQRIEAECERVGHDTVVSACITLVGGGEVDPRMLLVLGGPGAHQVLDDHEGGISGYWPRVWGARGLLHVWDDAAVEVILTALDDPAWRVREMALKVIAAHQVDDALEQLQPLMQDEVPRVRQAATRARQRLTETA